MKLIYVCSPYRGDIENNVEKAKTYCKQIIQAGNLPIAPHLYFTQFMNDEKEDEHNLALEFNKQLINRCEQVYVFGNTISDGMRVEINYAQSVKIPVYYIKE